MHRTHPGLRTIGTVAVACLALLTLPGFIPAFAPDAHAAPSATTPRGWHAFLPAATVKLPTGIAIDLRGARGAAQWGYVADAGTGRIVKFGTGGRVLNSWRYAAPGHPAALAVGGSGNLFVADKVNGNISKFSPAGKRLAFWPPSYYVPSFSPPYTDPRSIVVDPAGKLYLAEYSEHRIIQLSPGGTLLQTWDTSKGFTTQYSVPHGNSGPFGDPTGVVYDPTGHLFISTNCVPDPACLTERYARCRAPEMTYCLFSPPVGPLRGTWATSGSVLATPRPEPRPSRRARNRKRSSTSMPWPAMARGTPFWPERCGRVVGSHPSPCSPTPIWDSVPLPGRCHRPIQSPAWRLMGPVRCMYPRGAR